MEHIKFGRIILTSVFVNLALYHLIADTSVWFKGAASGGIFMSILLLWLWAIAYRKHLKNAKYLILITPITVVPFFKLIYHESVLEKERQEYVQTKQAKELADSLLRVKKKDI